MVTWEREREKKNYDIAYNCVARFHSKGRRQKFIEGCEHYLTLSFAFQFSPPHISSTNTHFPSLPLSPISLSFYQSIHTYTQQHT
ncbi:hypothetical protein VNO77_44412 [Canavalia gladiata]|uniref:Uncharacterized protein n=1 Tax=Canavalia gladiata TaxID=3824 RepID=A0AAN9PQC1_CANGL